MPIVELPDGTRIDFPDTMSGDEINAAVRKHLGQATAAPPPADDFSTKVRKFFDPTYPSPGAGIGDVAKQAAKGAAFLAPATIPGAAVGGALYGVGSSDAQNPVGLAVDALTGAAGGAALGAGAKVLGKALAPAADWLGSKATRYGRAAISGVSNALARRKPLAEEAVQQAFESGAIRPLSTVQGIAERLRNAADPLSEQYAAILQKLGDAGVKGPEARDLALSFLKDANTATIASAMGRESGGPYAEALREAGESILQRPPLGGAGRLGLMQAEGMKRGLQARAATEYVKEGPTSLAGAGRKETAARVRDAIEQAVQEQKALAPEAAAQFEPVKEQLHRTLQAMGAANEGAARYSRRQPFGLHEAMGLAAGIATGNPIEAVGSVGLMHAIKDRSASTGAWLANELAKAAQRAQTMSPVPGYGVVGAEEVSPALQALLRRLRGPVPAAAEEEGQ
jgi:hypothetical protein